MAPLVEYYVSTTENYTGGYAIDPSDEWSDREPAYYDIYVNYISKANPGITFDHAYGDEVEPGKNAWMVVATYSSGDTFGQSYGHKEFLFVTDSKERAEEFMGIAEAQKGFSFEFEGQHFSCPWVGYFESLQDMDIVVVPVM